MRAKATRRARCPTLRGSSGQSALCSALAGACVFGLLSLLGPGVAAAQIKQPGNHPHYSVELEPHLLLQWDRNWQGRGSGYGPGFRASIPILQDGPIPKINNSLGISFGVDWAYFNDCDGQPYSAACSVSQWWFPVVAQWNFFFTPIVSVFGEVGAALVSRHFSYSDRCPQVVGVGCSGSTFDPFQPVFYAGGRFLFSKSVGMVVRIGTPSLTIGADFLL